MNITIDETEIKIFPEDKNIVDVAKRAKIGIPAPCYLNNRKYGCCSACIVEVNGKNMYACLTKPEDGMSIVLKREDLDKLRKERLKIYKENMEKGVKGVCNCGCNDD
ncbi:2Fe-2S iron-sulfur cluster-binding protein [Thermoproteota archaeon]